MDADYAEDADEAKASRPDSLVQQWTAQIAALQRRAGRRVLSGWIMLGLGTALLCLVMNLLRPTAGVTLPAAAGIILVAALWLVLAHLTRRRATAQLAGEIREDCRREGIAPGEAVRALAELGSGRVLGQVLSAIDPAAAGLAELRVLEEDAFRFLALRPVPPLQFQVVRGATGNVSAVILQGEHRIDEFSRIAAVSLAHGAREEGIAALAMVDMLYHEIAPEAPERALQALHADPARAASAEAAHALFSGFDLLPEMAALAHAASGATPDRGFTGGCIDYMGQRTKEADKRARAWALLAGIPDTRTLPYLLEALEQRSHFPLAVAGMGRLGEASHAPLLEAMRSGRGRPRFHAAMALGLLQVAAARPLLRELLPSVRSPIERAGICCALARLGEEGHAAELQAMLDDRDPDARQAAAMALAHVDEPLAEDAYLRHLDDESTPVRLFLIRKLAARDSAGPALADALVSRLEDTDQAVREAAVDTLRQLAPEPGRGRIMALAASDRAEARLAACRVLAPTAGPEGVLLLRASLGEVEEDEDKRPLLLALGETGSAEAAHAVAAYLDDEGLSGTAFSALIQLRRIQREAVVRAIAAHHGSRTRLLALQALDGDAQSVEQIAGMLRVRTAFLTLLDLLDVAPRLRAPSLAAPLRELLAYRNHPRFPGDRSISYLALKALVHSELARQ